MRRELLLSKNIFTVSWVAFHGLILIAFLVSLFFYGKINFDGDVNTMFPENSANKAAKIADANIMNSGVKNNYILVGHEDFAKAKKVASQVSQKLNEYPAQFEKVIFEIEDSSMEEIDEFVNDWKFNLLDEKTVAQLSTIDGASEFAGNSLSEIYSGFSFYSLDHIDEDPFFLYSTNMKNCLQSIMDSGTSMRPKDGVLASYYNGMWYVLIRAVVTELGGAMSEKTSAIPIIYNTCFPLENDGIRFAFNGVTFHSHKSSSSALKETSLIGFISIGVIVVLLLAIFGSIKPLVGSLFSIVVSVAIAFCMTHTVFGKMHVVTLLFGTSLIGSSIDYSIHYFVSWKHNKKLTTTSRIRKHLFNGLILSLVSTEICYALLCGAPFDMLKQMAVFSFTGILSSFLTATGIFTLLRLPKNEKRRIRLLRMLEIKIPHRKHFAKIVPFVVIIVSGIILGVNYKKVRIQNDLGKLYVPSGRLKDDSQLTINVLNFDQRGWFIISGDSMEETLELEEKVSKRIDEELSSKIKRLTEGKDAKISPVSFICTSKFIPSVKRQKESIVACENLIPLVHNQFECIYADEDVTDLVNDFKISLYQNKNKFLTPKSKLPENIKSVLNIVWIGEVEGKYYSLIVPSQIVNKLDADYEADIVDGKTLTIGLSEDEYHIIENEFKEQGVGENIYFENRLKDLSAGLDHLTRIILIMFAIAFVIIFIVLRFFYNWKDTFKIALIPISSVLAIVTTFVLCGERIEFFGITGMILVFGLGLDYIIYKMENRESKIESFSIGLSFVTTAVSFGALILSTFVPIHSLGLSIFAGLVTAFICTIL